MQHSVKRDVDRQAAVGVGFAHDQRHVLDQTTLAPDFLGKLVERLHVVLAARLFQVALGVAPKSRRDGLEHGALVDQIVPDLQAAHLGIAADALAVGAHDLASRLLALRLVAAHKANGDGGAGGEPLEIPFPRAGMDLVEIVDREHQAALGRGIDAEV